MDFEITRILHHSVLVKDTQKSLAFYRDVLGLKVDQNRPEMNFAGAWLNVGNQQIHLLELPNPDPINGRSEHGGRDRHVALQVSDIDKLQQSLEAAGLNFSRSKSGRKALFVRDPDGNALEFVEEAR